MKNEARKMERSSVIMAPWREEAQVFICVSVQRVGGAELRAAPAVLPQLAAAVQPVRIEPGQS